MAVPSRDHVKWRDYVPTLLGFCKGLGIAAVQFQESMAKR